MMCMYKESSDGCYNCPNRNECKEDLCEDYENGYVD